VATSRTHKVTNFEKKINEKFNLDRDDWVLINRQIRKHSIATKKRSFIFKFYNKLTCTNDSFVRVGHTESTKCTYCDEVKQDYYHLFLDCPAVAEFRDAIQARWLQSSVMTLRDWVVGIVDAKSSNDRARCFIALEANHYIYNANWEKKELSLNKFKSRIYACERVERQIALESGKIEGHLRKWDSIKPLI